MNRWIQSWLNIPLRSLHFRLLLYSLLVGSIPLVCAMFIFYGQSSRYAEDELAGNIKQIHELIIRSIERELSSLDHIAVNVNADYIVQRYIESRGASSLVQDDAFKKHLDFMIHGQKAYSQYVTDICLSFEETGQSFCSNPQINSSKLNPPINKMDKAYILFADERSIPYGVMFVGPIYDLNTSVVKGQVAVVMNLGQLMTEMNSYHLDARHLVFSGDGTVVYSSGEQATAISKEKLAALQEQKTTDKYFISTMKPGVPGIDWISVLEVKNQFLTTSWRSLRNTLIVFFVIVLLLSGLSSIVFSRLITKPLLNLRSLFKRAELGDMQAYWTSVGTQEINDLGEGYNQMLNRVSELIKQVKHEEAMKKDAEIRALQYQLNPHFLYNTLNTIKWVAKIHKTPQISEVVSALVRLLQASLGKKGEFITIKEEISLIKDYMEIQNFRYGELIKIEYEVDPVAAVCLVPRMLLQPLVENALIHGIEPAKREGIVTIKAWLDRDLLMCQVEDNGRGFPEGGAMAEEGPKSMSAKERMSGIGLKHIREKIKLYYGPDYKMHIFSKPNQGTTIRLSLPIHHSEEYEA